MEVKEEEMEEEEEEQEQLQIWRHLQNIGALTVIYRLLNEKSKVPKSGYSILIFEKEG